MNVLAPLFLTKSLSLSPPISVFPFADMDATTAYSLQRCKILHLVRHGQGIHNVEGEKGNHVLLSDELFDAHLSPLGRQQVDNLRKQIQSCGLSKKIDLVITSPMSRTLQTALGVFGSEGHSMTVNEKNGAKSTLNGPPIVAVELCRERMGLHPCDKRGNISEYQSNFPVIDFKLVESEDDILWKADTRETLEEVADRGKKFIKWLWTRQEKEIAVVSHGIFLQETLRNLVNDPLMKTRFQNCEVRSVVIVDRSSAMMGSCNPGKIPDVLHLPNTYSKENIPREEVSK
ncbi:hypothetical protein LWI28_022691 [Acer negundo]|uniref:Phosphoglycerate mutase-like protein 1 n=1 Tax=Acer negundo TaxID=4023 RepID=A0AAD5P628_ACENE|nr:hypothetical protein LWI28_022691 [Acer negundo]KAK4852007.1 hypothetical protein QYF36_020219 [Acer negundo]